MCLFVLVGFGWVFIAIRGFFSGCGAQGLCIGVASRRRTQALGLPGPAAAALGLH